MKGNLAIKTKNKHKKKKNINVNPKAFLVLLNLKQYFLRQRVIAIYFVFHFKWNIYINHTYITIHRRHVRVCSTLCALLITRIFCSVRGDSRCCRSSTYRVRISQRSALFSTVRDLLISVIYVGVLSPIFSIKNWSHRRLRSDAQSRIRTFYPPDNIF